MSKLTKLILSIIISLLLSLTITSCEKELTGCGIVTGGYEMNGYYFLKVDFNGESENVDVSLYDYLHYYPQDTICF